MQSLIFISIELIKLKSSIYLIELLVVKLAIYKKTIYRLRLFS